MKTVNEFPNKETQFTSENQPKNRGRKKGSRNVSTMLRELLIQIDKDDEGDGDYGKPLAHILIEFIFRKNEKGEYSYQDSTRLKALINAIERLDGKAPQSIDHKGEPITKIVLERVVKKFES